MWEGGVCIYDTLGVFNNFPQRLAKWRWQRQRGPFTSKFCSSFFYFIFIFFSSRFLFSGRNDRYSPVHLVYSGGDDDVGHLPVNIVLHFFFLANFIFQPKWLIFTNTFGILRYRPIFLVVQFKGVFVPSYSLKWEISADMVCY